MEDLIPIIWVFVAVGAIIYNAVTKAKNKRGRGGHAGPAQSEAWPTLELPEEPARRTVPPAFETLRKAAERLQQAASQPETAATASADDFTTDTAYSASSVSSALPKAKNGKQHPAKAEMPENTLSDAQADSDAQAEEEIFDLRRAVIYSELLKPKFDE